jgi:hypothetical protein
MELALDLDSPEMMEDELEDAPEPTLDAKEKKARLHKLYDAVADESMVNKLHTMRALGGLDAGVVMESAARVEAHRARLNACNAQIAAVDAGPAHVKEALTKKKQQVEAALAAALASVAAQVNAEALDLQVGAGGIPPVPLGLQGPGVPGNHLVAQAAPVAGLQGAPGNLVVAPAAPAPVAGGQVMMEVEAPAPAIQGPALPAGPAGNKAPPRRIWD